MDNTFYQSRTTLCQFLSPNEKIFLIIFPFSHAVDVEILHHTSITNNIGQIIGIFYTAPMSVTYQPKKKKRSTTHGFLARTKTANGKNVLKRRRAKGRARVAV